jgi:hypothetical protein
MRIGRNTLIVLALPFVLAIVAANIQWAVAGLPTLPPLKIFSPGLATAPRGFPIWLRLTHWVNFFFLILLVRKRSSDPGGSSAAVLECPLYSRFGVASADSYQRSDRPGVDGQG